MGGGGKKRCSLEGMEVERTKTVGVRACLRDKLLVKSWLRSHWVCPVVLFAFLFREVEVRGVAGGKGGPSTC